MALYNNPLGAAIGQAARDEGYSGQQAANFIFSSAIETACLDGDVPDESGYPHQGKVCNSYGY